MSRGPAILARCRAATPRRARPVAYGRVEGAIGLALRARGVAGEVGDVCTIETPRGEVPAEILGFEGPFTRLLPLETLRGLSARATVRCTREPWTIPVGPRLLGRVMDGLGRAIDGGPPLEGGARRDLSPRTPAALSRPVVDRRLATGIRVLDLLHPLGRGQRIGVFAGAGVGKTTLVSSLVRNTEADVVVLALIGERGREVRDFLERSLPDGARERLVLVVATSDQPAQQRITGAHVAASVAESFRDEGRHVLLVMDSATRFATAVREAGLAAGEVPTQRGYPPSLFAELPRLVERFGNSERGSITAVLNVLVEGDDLEDPVADSLRGLLDGHWILSRRLAERGHYPAVDPLASLSRLAPQLQDDAAQRAAATVRAWLSRYEDARDLIELGAWQRGRDAALDAVVDLKPALDQLLQQAPDERADPDAAATQLAHLIARGTRS